MKLAAYPKFLALLSIGFATLLSWSSEGASGESTAYVGSISKLVPPVEWRQTKNSPAIPLSQARDLHRPLYKGNQLRCGKGGSVTIGLLGGNEQTVIPNAWNDITNNSVAFSQWLSDHMKRTGRPRETPQKRAVLVGINEYSLPAGNTNSAKNSRFENLAGCLNDLEGMRQLIITKFGFASNDIVVLTNSQATRTAILSNIENQLLDSPVPGDIALFFFAGHGSQRRNVASDEPDKLDETIVPADACYGVEDIRDKELRRIFNAIIDKKILLTAIFDSCHSGSVARPTSSTLYRYATPAEGQINDSSDYGPVPELRGAVILAACQEDELAGELSYANQAHGAFTAAILQVTSATNYDCANLPGVDLCRGIKRWFEDRKQMSSNTGISQVPFTQSVSNRPGRNLFGEPIR